MIELNVDKCRQCGICIDRYRGYCISEKDGYPVFDHSLCNLCRKCAAICPFQAIQVNGTTPTKIGENLRIDPADLRELMARRRSIKVFRDEPVPRELLARIVEVAKYAPNQNKNIDAIVVDDPALLGLIDRESLDFVARIDRLFFSFRPWFGLLRLFVPQMRVIKKKIDFDLRINKHIVKKNTQALIILVGPKRVPVTADSAPYLLAAMAIYAESLGIGSCLMDSLKISIGGSRLIRKKLGIQTDVLGVLSLGYSAENIVNVPEGYELNIQWNEGGKHGK